MLPPAPGLFSTVTVWPSAACNCSAISRATMSVELPGAKATTIFTGLSG
jgi:hypothetical protein